MASPKKKPSPAASVTATEPGTTRRVVHAADMVGDHDSCAHYRLEGATAATMLIRSISPWEGYAVVLGGLDHAADELSVISQAVAEVDIDRSMVSHVLAGIENRLRVLREIANRVHAAQVEEAKRGAA